MDTNVIVGLLGLVGAIHIFMASLSTIELKDCPLHTFPQKIIWFLVIWSLPFIGTYWFHKQTNIKADGSGSTAGDCTTGGYCGGDSGGGSGD